MEKEASGSQKESGFKLNTKQQVEIGDILLSARSISRQLVSQAKQQSEEILQNTRQQAAQIVAEAQNKAASVADEAEKKAAGIIREAEGKAAEIVSGAEEKAASVMSRTEKEAAAIVAEAEKHAAVILHEAERNANTPTVPKQIPVPEEMQDYVVQCVGDCFLKLRQQQLASIDLINEQWRSFLSNLMIEEAPPADGEISREDIETKVNDIAKELLDMIEQ